MSPLALPHDTLRIVRSSCEGPTCPALSPSAHPTHKPPQVRGPSLLFHGPASAGTPCGWQR